MFVFVFIKYFSERCRHLLDVHRYLYHICSRDALRWQCHMIVVPNDGHVVTITLLLLADEILKVQFEKCPVGGFSAPEKL